MSSINLGTPAMKAIQNLRDNEDFNLIVDTVGDAFTKKAVEALESEPVYRSDAVGYARGIRDVFLAMHAARTGVHQSTVKTPGLNETAVKAEKK